jgi:hypothetical protein
MEKWERWRRSAFPRERLNKAIEAQRSGLRARHFQFWCMQENALNDSALIFGAKMDKVKSCFILKILFFFPGNHI